VLEVACVRLIRNEDGVFREAGPFANGRRVIGVGETDCERVGFVTLLRPADVGEPVLAVVRAEFVRGVFPTRIVKREPAVGLPRIPALAAVREDLAEALPLQQVVADGRWVS
jgi:hypothetical protein